VTDLNHTHEPEERAGQFPPLDGTHPGVLGARASARARSQRDEV